MKKTNCTQLSVAEQKEQNLIAEKLYPVAIKTAHEVSRKFQKGNFASILSYEEILGIANELVEQISKQVIIKEVDEKGMYSYLHKSIINRSKDLYKAQAKTIKRGSNITMVNDDVSNMELTNYLDQSPESILIQSSHIQDGLKFLQNFDTAKAPISLVMKLSFESYSTEEIHQKTGIPSSTIERYKKKGISLLSKFFESDDCADFTSHPSNNAELAINASAPKINEHVIPNIIKHIVYKNDQYTLHIIGASGFSQNKIIKTLDSFTFSKESDLTLFLKTFTAESENIYKKMYLEYINNNTKEEIIHAA